VSAEREPGAGETGFEEMYVRAGSDLGSIPWASLTVNPALEAWLNGQPASEGSAALVVGCGLGDDAEELARRGYQVTAFDISPTAIDLCRRRFPGSVVDYVVADLFAAPDPWQESFSLVVEIRTLQSLPGSRRSAARAIARNIAPGGRLFVRCLGRDSGEELGARPWPVTRSELHAFTEAGLIETDFSEASSPQGSRMFTAVYRRPSR
jgi:SAM-dependent methyltransferase